MTSRVYDLAEEHIAWCKSARTRLERFEDPQDRPVSPTDVFESFGQDVPDDPSWHDAFNVLVRVGVEFDL